MIQHPNWRSYEYSSLVFFLLLFLKFKPKFNRIFNEHNTAWNYVPLRSNILDKYEGGLEEIGIKTTTRKRVPSKEVFLFLTILLGGKNSCESF